MKDQCSIISYKQIIDSKMIAKAQAMYLYIFRFMFPEPLTHRDATELVNAHFGTHMPERNGRVAELEAMGFLIKVDTIICNKTKKRVNRWKFTGRLKPKLKAMRRVSCPHCNGKGHLTVEEYLDL